MKLMKLKLATFLLLAIAFVNAQPRTPNTPALQKSEMRCGWFSNPTPGNASLHDRDAEWIIGVQGGYQAEGDWPEFGPKQWIETNVHYVNAGACMKIRVNRETQKFIEIESAKPRPLSACRNDRKL